MASLETKENFDEEIEEDNEEIKEEEDEGKGKTKISKKKKSFTNGDEEIKKDNGFKELYIGRPPSARDDEGEEGDELQNSRTLDLNKVRKLQSDTLKKRSEKPLSKGEQKPKPHHSKPLGGTPRKDSVLQSYVDESLFGTKTNPSPAKDASKKPPSSPSSTSRSLNEHSLTHSLTLGKTQNFLKTGTLNGGTTKLHSTNTMTPGKMEDGFRSSWISGINFEMASGLKCTFERKSEISKLIAPPPPSSERRDPRLNSQRRQPKSSNRSDGSSTSTSTSRTSRPVYTVKAPWD